MAGEALFYHLTTRPLEAAAPEILEKALARGLRVTFRFGGAERMAAMSAHLWTWRDDSFLPHGDPSDGFAERQPIYLTAGPETPNTPDMLMLADGAEAAEAEFARFARVAVLFDGRDDAAVGQARAQWRVAGAAGCACKYWSQDDAGRWTLKSERPAG
jgi:DNA polymerase-3 subunit chi